MQNLRKACDCIRKAKRIVVSGHVNPDGDSIGSMLALGLGLEMRGKKVCFLCQGEVPAQYCGLPGADRIARTVKGEFDLAVAVDCSTVKLLGANRAVFERAGRILVIDHHEYKSPFGDIEFIDHKAAAVGELVHILLEAMGVKMTRAIAENILTSIIVETNLFKLSNIRPITFAVCEAALQTGIDFSRLTSKVYGPRTRAAALLLATALLRARMAMKGRVIWSVLRKSDLMRVGGKECDTDAIAGELRSMRGVRAAVLFREKDRHVLRVSLRSAGNINIGKLAQSYGGGGHFDIAGCYIPNSRHSMQRMLLSVKRIVR